MICGDINCIYILRNRNRFFIDANSCLRYDTGEIRREVTIMEGIRDKLSHLDLDSLEYFYLFLIFLQDTQGSQERHPFQRQGER